MAHLPPKPGDSLPPRPSRVGTSPRAASMRDDVPRERDRDRDDWRRRSPPPPRRSSPSRQDSWRRPPRDDDRYQDQTPRKTRDRDDRGPDRPRARGGRDRVTMDTYRPGSPRRRSPPPRRRASRSRSPRSERVPHSPPRYRPRSPPHSRRPPSSERRKHWSEHSVSPHPRSRKRSHDSRGENRKQNRASRSKSRGPSDSPNEEADFDKTRARDSGKSKEPVLVDEPTRHKQDVETPTPHVDSSKEVIPPIAKKLPIHPPPSGPRHPRTPTGPRARSPASTRLNSPNHELPHREDKGKGKEISREVDGHEDKHGRERSVSPPRGPRKRTRRSWSSSHSRSHSRSLSRSPRSRSPRSRSRSLSRSHSHRTRSDRTSPHAPTGPREDRNAGPRNQETRKLVNVDDLLPPLKPRLSKTLDLDAKLKAVQEQRAKLETEHVNIMRGVRRAQHELDLARLETTSAEERRKAAQRVHERTVKGFLPPLS